MDCSDFNKAHLNEGASLDFITGDLILLTISSDGHPATNY